MRLVVLLNSRHPCLLPLLYRLPSLSSVFLTFLQLYSSIICISTNEPSLLSTTIVSKSILPPPPPQSFSIFYRNSYLFVHSQFVRSFSRDNYLTFRRFNAPRFVRRRISQVKVKIIEGKLLKKTIRHPRIRKFSSKNRCVDNDSLAARKTRETGG